MTTQLTAVRITASGQVSLSPGRVRNIHILGGAAAGSIILIDGSVDGTGGKTVAVIDTAPGAGGSDFLKLSGLGLKFNSNIYCTFATTAPLGVTFFIG